MSQLDEDVEFCKLAEQAERYDDMAPVMKKIVESKGQLTNEECNLFSIAYKNLVGNRRCSCRLLSSVAQKLENSPHQQQLAREYRETIEKELETLCQEVLVLLETYLIPKVGTAHSKLIYVKMTCDYYRYLAEITTGGERQRIIEKIDDYCNEIFHILRNEFRPTDPTRLSFALNYSCFYYDILNAPERACHLAKQTFDDAIAELDTLDEQSYKESTLLLQMLRDNLTLWTAADAFDVNDDKPSEVHR